MIPKFLYHGTNKENLESVQEQGIIAYTGFVYLTEDLEMAKLFSGDGVVFKVKTEDMDKEYLGSYREMMCDILKTSDFWHYGDNIPTEWIAETIHNHS